MAEITLRVPLGRPLTYQEVDDNFRSVQELTLLAQQFALTAQEASTLADDAKNEAIAAKDEALTASGSAASDAQRAEDAADRAEAIADFDGLHNTLAGRNEPGAHDASAISFMGSDVNTALVNRVVYCNDIENLISQESLRLNGAQVSVAGFYKNSKLGGGVFEWDSDADKNTADGGNRIDPDAGEVFDGTENSLYTYLASQLSATGKGLWIRVKLNRSVCPYEFGYAGTYMSGMEVCRHIFKVFKRDGGGELVMPSGDFYLGGQDIYSPTTSRYVEMGSNVVWKIPTGSTVHIDGCFAMVWRPTGYGYDGGEKGFTLTGGGAFSGVNRINPRAFISMNPTHVRGFAVKRIHFIEAADGHILDLMGNQDIVLEDLIFEGSTTDFSDTGRAGNEFIQLDTASDSGRRYRIKEDNKWLDLIPCSRVVMRRIKSIARRDSAGNIISYPQISIGTHYYNAANIDSLIMEDIYVEQTNPNAPRSKDNIAAVRIPPCSNFRLNGFVYKVLEQMQNLGNGYRALVMPYTQTYHRMLSESNSSEELPTYESVTRPEPESLYEIENITLDFSAHHQVNGSTTFLGVVCYPPAVIDGVTIYGTNPNGFRNAFDVFSIGRKGDLSLGSDYVFPEDAKWLINNVKTKGGVRHIAYGFHQGILEICNISGEAEALYNSTSANVPEYTAFIVNNINLIGSNPTSSPRMQWGTGNIKLSNCILDLVGPSGEMAIIDLPAGGGGYVINCAFRADLPSSYEENPGLMLSNNINLNS